MKNILAILCITIFGVTFTINAQSTFDAHGNFNSRNSNFVAEKSVAGSAKTTSNAPIIINTIPSPVTLVGDIAFDGEGLWVEGYGVNLLYKISPVDGSVIKTIYSNIMRPYGLEFDNGYLWVTDNDNTLIQQVDTSNGNIITTFSTPCISNDSYPTGLAWDGQNLWSNDAMSTGGNPFDSTYKITSTGQILQMHHGFGTYVTGLAWDGQYLWSSDNVSQHLYKINVSSFTVIDTIDAPGGPFPNGLAFDGQYLWVSNNESDSLYQIDISNTNTGLPSNTLTNNSGFSIYPNPSSDEITISLFNKNMGSTYSITDQTGRQILNGKLNNETTKININELAEGIYLFRVGEKYIQTFEVIKK